MSQIISIKYVRQCVTSSVRFDLVYIVTPLFFIPYW